MRTVLMFVLGAALFAAPVRAQSYDDQPANHKVIKILVGASALAIGTTVAAKSSQTTTVNSALGASETSTFSTSQLVTGLVIAGAGGVVLWDGLRTHHPQPSTQFGVAMGKTSGGLFVKRTW